MITPVEIQKQAHQKYLAFLRARVQGDSIFPLDIRFGKARASDDYLALRQWVGELLTNSKAERGFGYEVVLEEQSLRRYGRQSLPTRITIETEADYLALIGKADEFRQWQRVVTYTLERLPQLEDWLAQYPQRVLPYLAVWDELLTVCAYFLAHPWPHLYVRELPIPVHTKFIEENQVILRQLLDVLLAPDAIRYDETQFERRFGLRYDEPQIRVRLLDDRLCRELGWPAADLGLTLSDCAGLTELRGRTAFIVENKMTFLTLPPVENGFAIWGKGFQVSLLREIAWLAQCAIWYWGDLDAQGFAILAQLRAQWPHTRSFLMDAVTLEKYQLYIVTGTPHEGMSLPHLTEEEKLVYEKLASQNWRLEQERINHGDVLQAIRRLSRSV